MAPLSLVSVLFNYIDFGPLVKSFNFQVSRNCLHVAPVFPLHLFGYRAKIFSVACEQGGESLATN